MSTRNDMQRSNDQNRSSSQPMNQGSSTGGQQPGLLDSAREAQGSMAQTAQETIDTTKETAQQTMDMVKDAAQEIGGQTKQQASDVVSQAADQLTQTASDLKDQAETSFTQQRDRTVQGLNALADALRQAGRNLGNNQQGGSDQQQIPAAIGPLVEEAADRLQHSAQFLRDKEMSGLLSDAQSLARKQPLLFMGAMFGIGIVGARLVKDATSMAGNGSGSGSGNGPSGQSTGQGMSGNSGRQSSTSQPYGSSAGSGSHSVGQSSTSQPYGSNAGSGSQTSRESSSLTKGTTAPSAHQVGNTGTEAIDSMADWQEAGASARPETGQPFGSGLSETLPTGSAGTSTPNETSSGSEKVR